LAVVQWQNGNNASHRALLFAGVFFAFVLKRGVLGMITRYARGASACEACRWQVVQMAERKTFSEYVR